MKKKANLLLLFSLGLISCHKDPPIIDPQDYPVEIGNIIIGKCTTSGCHNSISYPAAGGLNLSTWGNLFEGSHIGGSCIIPFRPDFSSICFFTNTFPDLGVAAEPTMPINGTRLSREQYITLRDWITAGAPDSKGRIKFADDPNRKKIYVTNQICDVVTVFDSETLLQMRYINVGNRTTTEFPHCIKVSPDKKYWYVSFFVPSTFVQKFSAADDQLIGEINLGTGAWHSFAISSDSHYGFFADNSGTGGKIAYVDLQNMSVLATYTFAGDFEYMSGIALNDPLKKIYIGSLSGNFIYKIDISDPLLPVISEIIIDGSSTVQHSSTIDPVDVVLDPVGNKCYVACQKTNEIRVMDMQADTLLGTISLNSYPAYMSYSQFAQKLFVTCPDDSVSFPGNRGSVVVIDGTINSIFKKVNSGYQPYGLDVDDQQKIVAVANANLSSDGPTPHHVSGCGGRNGNVTFIDLTTFDLIPDKKSEVAVFPYAVSTR